MRAPDPASGKAAHSAAVPRGGRPPTAQVRFAEVERGVSGLIHDLAVAHTDLADREQTARQREDAFLLSLVEVLDAFERVLTEMSEGGHGEHGDRSDAPTWVGNVRTVYRLLENAVRAQGTTAMEPARGEFDPHLQTALQTVNDPDADPGTIFAEVYRGYVVGDRVLRKPGVVVVGPASGGADRG